jgi:hypothetical protein
MTSHDMNPSSPAFGATARSQTQTMSHRNSSVGQNMIRQSTSSGVVAGPSLVSPTSEEEACTSEAIKLDELVPPYPPKRRTAKDVAGPVMVSTSGVPGLKEVIPTLPEGTRSAASLPVKDTASAMGKAAGLGTLVGGLK